MTGAGVRPDVVGKILNHADSSVTAVYVRHSYDPEKRRALDLWGRAVEVLDGGGAVADVPVALVESASW